MNAISPMLQRQLDLGFVRRGSQTAFERRLFSWPFVLTRTFALDPSRPHLRTVILQSSAGAMHGEDRLNQRLVLGPDAAVHFTTQGAASVHRAPPGIETRETTELVVAPGAWLEYLPQPRILFPGAALNQSITADCAAGATLFVADAFTRHDPEGSGRSFRRLETSVTFHSEGRLVALDRSDITGHARHFTRHGSFGSLYVIAARPIEFWSAAGLDLNARFAEIEGLYAAASLLPGAAGLGIRLAAAELRQLRAGLDLAVVLLRAALLDGA